MLCVAIEHLHAQVHLRQRSGVAPQDLHRLRVSGVEAAAKQTTGKGRIAGPGHDFGDLGSVHRLAHCALNQCTPILPVIGVNPAVDKACLRRRKRHQEVPARATLSLERVKLHRNDGADEHVA